MSAQITIPSFVASLKTLRHITYDAPTSNNTKSVLMVVLFDHSKLIETCTPGLAAYDESMCNYDYILSEVAKINEVWISRSELYNTIMCVAKLHGWHPRLRKRLISCTRFDSDKKGTENSTRCFTNGPLYADCPCCIEMKPLVRSSYIPKNSTNGKLQYRDMWDKPIMITRANCFHGSNCRPSCCNRVIVTKRSGAYSRNVPPHALFTLCNYHEQGIKLSHIIIKSVLRPIWPSQKSITGGDTYKMRLKIQQMLPTFRQTNSDYHAFTDVANDSILLNGIDDQVMVTDDEAYTMAYTVCDEVLNEKTTGEDEIFSFVQYLDLISTRAKGFSYEVLSETNSQSSKKKLLGVLWQTATMRRNFDLHGDFGYDEVIIEQATVAVHCSYHA